MEFYVTRENSLSHKEDDSLQHYGILGMKWGVRRYQNYDGTRTAAGKKRYWTGAGLADKDGESTGKGSARTKKIATKGSSDKYGYDSAKEGNDQKVRDISKELLSEREMMNTKSQRSIDAAVTGLNCIKAARPWDGDDFDPNDKWDQEWFLVEDQTFGLPQVADLANKGYSAEKIQSIIEEGLKAYEQSNYYYHDLPDGTDTSGLWYLDGGYYNSDYINACVEYVKSKKK